VSRLLDDLGGEERARAGRVLATCPRIEIARGQAARPRDAALLVVEDGIVVLSAADARTIAIAVAPAGDVLAPLADGEQLRGLTDARVTAVTREAECALLRIPGAAQAVADGLVAALRDRKASLAIFARFPHSERVRGKLLQLARRHGRVVEGGVVIDLPLTHDLLAESVGSTRETVTLALRELMRSGFVERAGRRIRLRVAPEELA
jgi:CRP/FNR family cyclic AMP-dependent transcriptional regulator